MAKRSNEKWTEEEDRRLLELRAVRKSTVMMAVTLKRSVLAVRGRLGMLRGREIAKAKAPDLGGKIA